MKRRILTICLALVGTIAIAEDRTFPTGSLIIPMDSQTQDTFNDGIFEAYGLVYELLVQGVTVHVIIKEDKQSNEDPDLVTTDVPITVVSGELFVPVDPIPQQYLGGPWMIDAQDAATALRIISESSPLYDHVVVHRFDEPVTAPVGATYQNTPRQIALLNNSDNEGETLLACYLELAGVPQNYYVILDPTDVAAGDLTVADFFILWVPHFIPADEPWPDATETEMINNVLAFADAGGNVLYTCKSIDTWESVASLMTSTFMGINGTTIDPTVYENFDLPFSQIGDYPFVPDVTNDTQNYRNYQAGDTPTTGTSSGNTSAWNQNVNLIARDSTADNPWTYYAMRTKDSDPNKGNLHMIAGHRYVSCEPIISPGVTYRIDLTMKSCRRNVPEFWTNPDAEVTIILEYDGGEESLTIGPMSEGTFADWANTDFLAQTIDGRTNYGPGCNGQGSPAGTDHLDGIFITNQTTNNYRITNVTVLFDCHCGHDYVFQQFDIQLDNGQCGTSSCGFCSDVYPNYNPRNCDNGTVSFVPRSRKGGGTDVIFAGGTGDPNQPPVPRPQNIGGIRYILNTLFNNIVDPVAVQEFARSGPVVDDDVLYFGTFEYPGNAGHFRAYPLVDSNGNSLAGTLTESWDAAGFAIMPAWTDRVLFTYINGVRQPVHQDNAAVIEAYINDPNDTVASVAEDIKNFRGQFRAKRFGGVERSTPAIVPPNERSNSNRPAVGYVGTTYGVLEFIRLEDGVEMMGYVPAALMTKLKNIRSDDADRPKVDSSPVVLDAFLPVDPNNQVGSRHWRTIVASGHGTGAKGISALDVTDPTNPTLLWSRFDPNVFGYAQRVSVARYKKQVGSLSVLGYAAIVTTNDPDDVNGHGLRIFALDLQTGQSIWPSPFIRSYNSTGQNDLPASAAVADLDSDSFDDSLLVGDLNGRLWRIDIATGNAIPPSASANPAIPLFDASVGAVPSTNDRPIAATPSVGEYAGHKVVAFGTGGTDWSGALNNIVVVYDLKDEQLLIPPINLGELKLYAPITFAGGRIFFVAVRGSLNSANPTFDLPDVNDPTPSAFLFSVDLDPTATNRVTQTEFTKSRASVYIKNGQVFGGSIDGTFKGFNDRVDQQTIRAFQQLIWKNTSLDN
ncbi:MAG: hypothetical protein KDC35_05770 [Acidobacteria bacterium]|nr:hypothetical protein [Acidobacteriota bacterium]